MHTYGPLIAIMVAKMSLLHYGVLFILSDLSHKAHPLFCDHRNYTASTTRTNRVQLLLNCSSNYMSVTTLFNISSNFLLEYTILYTCTHHDYPGLIQHVAIDSAIANKKKTLDDSIPCGSLCTFGGCYSSGPLGSVVDHLIAPVQSCYVCNGGESGVCTDQSCNESDVQCVPSLHLGNGTVECDCDACVTTSNSPALPVSETTTLSESTTFELGGQECTCSCAALFEGYKCLCSDVQLDIPCSDTSGCELYYCESIVNNCQDIEDAGHCFCNGRNGYNCTSTKSSTPFDTIVTSVLAVSVLLISLTAICIIAIPISIMIRNRRNRVKRPVFTDLTRYHDEMFTFDPVDITTSFAEARSDSFLTLFDVLFSVDLKQSTSLSSSSNSCVNTEGHLSDAEGYIICKDCPCFGDSSEIKTCQHCQMNKDEQT